MMVSGLLEVSYASARWEGWTADPGGAAVTVHGRKDLPGVIAALPKGLLPAEASGTSGSWAVCW